MTGQQLRLHRPMTAEIGYSSCEPERIEWWTVNKRITHKCSACLCVLGNGVVTCSTSAVGVELFLTDDLEDTATSHFPGEKS